KLLRVVLSPPREELYARIAERFGAMVAAGALEEAKALEGLDPNLPAARALGLPQLLSHLSDGAALETVTEEAVMQTRRYAKRQLTWFRRFMADWKWLESRHLRNIIAITS